MSSSIRTRLRHKRRSTRCARARCRSNRPLSAAAIETDVSITFALRRDAMPLPGPKRYLAILGLVAVAVGCTTSAVVLEAPSRETHDGLTQLLYPPSTGKGPIVVILSGYSG